MELIHYIRLIRRWLWLLVLSGFVGGSIAFINASRQPLRYQVRSLIAIGGYFQSPNPSANTIGIGQRLTETYAQLARTQKVLGGALDALDDPISSQHLNSILSTYIIPDTSLLEIYVTYTDPILTADLANKLAEQLILASPSNLTQEQRQQISLLNQQIQSLTEEISDLRLNLSDIDLQLATTDLTSATRVELQVERLTLIEQINNASNNVAQFSSTVAELQIRTNSVEIVELAQIPEFPLPQFGTNTLITGAITAIVLVGGILFLFEYVNSTFHSTDEANLILKRPILGAISNYGRSSDSYPDKLLTNKSNERVPDEFRILRTNLLFSSDVSSGIYITTSAIPNEGKTTIVSNLSVSLAMSGLHVLLIDADLRKPQIHKVFGVDNKHGLTSLLTASLTPNQIAAHSGSSDLDKINSEESMLTWQDTIKQIQDIDNLWVLTSGFPIENPTELLGSTIMKNWIDAIQENFAFDIILIDTPPILGFPDSAVMAVSLGARVIPVIRANKTRHEAAKRMIERLDQVQAELVGIVLNQTNSRDENYQEYSYYVDYYQSS